MKNALFVLAIFFIAFDLYSQEITKIFNFAEDVRDVVLKSPGGHPMPKHEFNLRHEQADQMNALATLDNITKSYIDATKNNCNCDKPYFLTSKEAKENLRLQKRVDERYFQIEAMVLVTDHKFEQNSLGRFMTDDYINYMGQLKEKGNNKADDIYSLDALISKYKSSNPGTKFDNLKLIEKERDLTRFANNYLGMELPQGFIMKEIAFKNMIEHPETWNSTLAQAKDIMSSEQKIQLVSKLGVYLGNNYDNERTGSGDVDTEQLLISLKNGNPTGNARNIALAQTNILKELGFNKSYIVSYKTINSTNTVAITTDPTTGKVLKFNYNEVTESPMGVGAEALIQDTSIPDHGLEFRVYDSNGKQVTHVPSELSKILRETTGGNEARSFMDPALNIMSVDFSNSRINGNVFTGTMSSGEVIYGVSAYKNINFGEYLTTGAGISLSKSEGDRKFFKVDQANLYMRANAELSAPTINLNSVNTRPFIGGSGEVLISNNKETDFKENITTVAKKEVDANADVYLGVQNEITAGGNTFDSKIYANFYPDWNHSTPENKKTVYFDSVIIKTGVTHEISNYTRALLDTAVVVKNYGSSFIAKGLYEDENNNVKYFAGGASPLTKGMPDFLPGKGKRVFGGIEKSSKDGKTTITITYERNLDNDSNNVMLNGEIKF